MTRNWYDDRDASLVAADPAAARTGLAADGEELRRRLELERPDALHPSGRIDIAALCEAAHGGPGPLVVVEVGTL